MAIATAILFYSTEWQYYHETAVNYNDKIFLTFVPGFTNEGGLLYRAFPF